MGGSCSDGRWAGHMFVTGVARRRCEWRPRECDMQCVLGSLGCVRKCAARGMCVREGREGANWRALVKQSTLERSVVKVTSMPSSCGRRQC